MNLVPNPSIEEMGTNKKVLPVGGTFLLPSVLHAMEVFS